MATVTIEQVRDAASAEHLRVMALEFIPLLRDRYPELNDAIDLYLDKQDFSGMPDRLPESFTRPKSNACSPGWTAHPSAS
jgi:hypothetical protein